jgi:hypothetical protein
MFLFGGGGGHLSGVLSCIQVNAVCIVTVMLTFLFLFCRVEQEVSLSFSCRLPFPNYSHHSCPPLIITSVSRGMNLWKCEANHSPILYTEVNDARKFPSLF